MSKILAIDVGEKRVGLATSDETRLIAAPYGFLDRDGAVDNIADILVQESIGQIVVGLPYMPSGAMGSQAGDVQTFVTSLREKTSAPIDFENEVLSTVEATNRLKQMKRKIKHKGEVDAMAAAVILEAYLNRSES